MGKDLTASNEPSNIHEAVMLLNEKLGSSLSADDPNIINAVRNLYIHKKKFEKILTTPSQGASHSFNHSAKLDIQDKEIQFNQVIHLIPLSCL